MMPATKATLAATFGDPQAFGTLLAVATYVAYGTEPFGTPAGKEQDALLDGPDSQGDPDGWLPESFLRHIQDDFQVQFPPSSLGKLMAAVTLIRSPDRFYGRVTDFMDLCNALNGDSYDPAVVDPVDALEAAWALSEARFLEWFVFEPSDDPADQLPELSPEIRGYIGKVLDNEGIMTPPDILRLAVHDPDRRLTVLSDFSDDPAMYAAVSDAEDAKSRRIVTELKLRLRLLFQQLARLFGTDVPDVVKSLGLASPADPLLNDDASSEEAFSL